MNTAEKCPNLARLTALLNQQDNPRRMLRTLVFLMGREQPEGGAQHDARKHD